MIVSPKLTFLLPKVSDYSIYQIVTVKAFTKFSLHERHWIFVHVIFPKLRSPWGRHRDYLLLHCEKETETQRDELTGPWSCSVGVAEPEFGFRLYHGTPKPGTSLLCPVLSQEIIYKRNLNNHNSAV